MEHKHEEDCVPRTAMWVNFDPMVTNCKRTARGADLEALLQSNVRHLVQKLRLEPCS